MTSAAYRYFCFLNDLMCSRAESLLSITLAAKERSTGLQECGHNVMPGGVSIGSFINGILYCSHKC